MTTHPRPHPHANAHARSSAAAKAQAMPLLLRALPHLIIALGLSAAMVIGANNAHAQGSTPTATAGAATALPWVDAEVRKIDTAQGKVTLKHGEIPNMDMPPMTMVFKAVDPGMLKGLLPGDKVRFQAEDSNGTYMAVQIEKRP